MALLLHEFPDRCTMTTDDEIKELKQKVASLEQKHELLDQSYLKNIRYLSQRVA
jgi:hypothetical protein